MNKLMKFKPGDEVEILRRNEESNGSWFPAVISSVLVDKYSVRCKLFISPRGKPVVETVDDKDVRPSPPFVPCKQDWSIGEIAEVLDIHSWKVAKIAKILKNGYVVAKVFGSIQLKMFPLYDVRVRQAWQNNHWVNKITNEKHFDCGPMPSSSKHTTHKFGRKQFCATPQTTLNRDRNLRYISTPDHGIRANNRKRKPSSEADDPDLLTKPKSSKTRRNINTQIHTDRMFLDDHDTRLFRRPMGVAEEVDECSVASCSSNNIAESYSGGTRKHSMNASGESSDFMQENTFKDKLAASIHMLELQAYQSTLQALYASGPLSWEQESLLTNLRLSLNITNEEHLLHLKQLLSVSDRDF